MDIRKDIGMDYVWASLEIEDVLKTVSKLTDRMRRTVVFSDEAISDMMQVGWRLNRELADMKTNASIQIRGADERKR